LEQIALLKKRKEKKEEQIALLGPQNLYLFVSDTLFILETSNYYFVFGVDVDTSLLQRHGLTYVSLYDSRMVSPYFSAGWFPCILWVGQSYSGVI
jgi:hypothetical protein